jgi:hypothetical protein
VTTIRYMTTPLPMLIRPCPISTSRSVKTSITTTQSYEGNNTQHTLSFSETSNGIAGELFGLACLVISGCYAFLGGDADGMNDGGSVAGHGSPFDAKYDLLIHSAGVFNVRKS